MGEMRFKHSSEDGMQYFQIRVERALIRELKVKALLEAKTMDQIATEALKTFLKKK